MALSESMTNACREREIANFVFCDGQSAADAELGNVAVLLRTYRMKVCGLIMRLCAARRAIRMAGRMTLPSVWLVACQSSWHHSINLVGSSPATGSGIGGCVWLQRLFQSFTLKPGCHDIDVCLLCNTRPLRQSWRAKRPDILAS